jgi:predicted permease
MAPPGRIESSGGYFIDRKPEQPDEFTNAPFAMKNIVAPGTFAALGIPLKNGRDFSDRDTRDKPFVAVVNEALVRRSFGREDPVGRTIYCPFDSFTAMTIIGVVGDVHQRGPASDPAPECYMPYRQHAFNGNTLSVVVRTAGNPAELAETLRQLAQQRSPEVPMRFTTMETVSAENIAVPRFRGLLFAVFAGLAVCLAMAGIYGVMAYVVAQRSNEIGLRIALGASSGSIFRLVLGKAAALATIGLIAGLALAIAGTRMLATMLFQVKPLDPAVYLAVAVSVGFVTLLAGYLPARRSSKIDPMIALRQE